MTVEDVTDPRQHPFFMECEAWLAAHGERVAEVALRRARLFRGAGELVTDAWLRIYDAVRNHPDADRAMPAEAYCRVVIRHLVDDISRGVRRRREEFAFWPGSNDDPATSVAGERAAPNLASVATDSSSSVDQMRAMIESCGDHPPWVVSAALTYVTVGMDSSVDTHPAPTPRAGANPVQARMWPALWFAGQRDGVFPHDDGGDAAQRQRLSRMQRRVRELLEDAVARRSIEGPTS